MYEKLEKCPSCDHPKFHNFLICEDHVVSHESFALVKCKNCQLIFTNPRPEESALGKYYESEEYISHTDKGNSLINIIYKTARYFTLRKKRRLIGKYSPIGTILDYGCGTGDFLKTCQQKKWKVIGVEPNDKANNIASSKLGTSIYQSLENLKGEDKVDVITAWHVLEHVSDLRETLKTLRKKLRKSGHLIIAVPNPDSFDAEHYAAHWAGFDVPRHLYHFTPDSLKTLVKRMKLELVQTIPMKLDAYYVSLLSEKNRSGKGSFIAALMKGAQSNLRASKTGNYSSLIYILKKRS